MTDSENPALEPAEAPQALPDNVVSLSAHAVGTSGLQAHRKQPQSDPHQERADREGITRAEAKAANYRDVYSERVPQLPRRVLQAGEQPAQVRAIMPDELAVLVRDACRSGSPRNRRAAVHRMSEQVTALQRAILDFRTAVQRAMLQQVGLVDAARAFIRVTNPEAAAKLGEETAGERRVLATVDAVLAAIVAPGEQPPKAEKETDS